MDSARGALDPLMYKKEEEGRREGNLGGVGKVLHAVRSIHMIRSILPLTKGPLKVHKN